MPKLAERMNGEIKGMLGVSCCNNEEQWKYFIAVESTDMSGEFEEFTVPASTWAIFPGEDIKWQKLLRNARFVHKSFLL